VTQSITVNITNLNDNIPIFSSGNLFTVDENQSGIEIGTVIFTDLDGDIITYSIQSRSDLPNWTLDNGFFTIDSSTGVINFVNWRTLNYENQSSYSIIVVASDGENSIIQSIAINVNDINDSPRLSVPTTINADENQTDIVTVTAIDEDGDDLTFSISGTDASVMRIGSSTGVLEFNVAPDYETKSSYTVDVSVSDGQVSDNRNITIEINNVNESNPSFTSSNIFTVDENQEAIGTVTAIDSIDGDAITYSLDQNGNNNKEGIYIHPSTGVLSFLTININDYEENTNFLRTVYASDGFMTTTQDITININNLNDNAPTFTPWCSSLYADENQTAIINCVTGDSSIEATDADGDPISFSMVSSDELTISSSGVLSFSSPPDFESGYAKSGVVSVTDGTFVTDSNITVILNNLNDNAPTFSSDTQTFRKDERQWNSDCVLTCPEIGTVTATDADFESGFNGGVGFEVSYSIISQDPANAFEINASTGAINSVDPHLDYETDSSYEFTVQASDGDFSDTIDVTVNVNNVDESSFFTSPRNLSIEENQTVVAIITADDYEGTYQEGNPINIFLYLNGGGGNPQPECQSGSGLDCEFFPIETLSPNTARLIMTAPDYENPLDANEDNVYEITLGARMGAATCGYHEPYCGPSYDFTVTVLNVVGQ